MNFRFEPYCENCEFVEPVAVKSTTVERMLNGDRFIPKMTIMCNHARLCKRLHHNIKAVEEAKTVFDCSDEGLSPGNLAYVRQLEREEMMAKEVLNCSDEAAES